MNILIVRHGQTDWNVLNKMQGIVDIKLNETGKKQAYNLQNKLKDRSFDIIFSSPLLRARETAEIINTNFKNEVKFDDRLKERDCGELEGIEEKNFDYIDFWNINTKKHYANEENIKKFYKRIESFIEEIQSKYRDKDILTSTHGGVCRMITYYFEKEKYKDGKLAKCLPYNCGILEYKI